MIKVVEAPPLLTERLVLRAWREEDKAPFAVMNADPVVMRYFNAVQSRSESDELAERLAGFHATHGVTVFAIEKKDDGRFIGCVGVKPVHARMPVAPAMEVGWRLAADAWGQGYATEAARESLRFAFEEMGLTQILALTARINAPSRGVMERLGMERAAERDFEDPEVPEARAELRPHVVYQMDRAGWERSRA